MRVLILRTIPYTENNPFNHLLRDIYKELLSRGISIHRVISVYKGQSPEDVLPLEYNTEVMTHDVVEVPQVTKSNFMLRYIASLWAALRLTIKGLKRKDIDVLLVSVPQSAIIPVLLAKVKRKKIVLLLQDIWPDNACEIGVIKRDSLIFKILSGIQKKIYKSADAIITISEDMKKLITSYGVDNNISIAYNWSYSDRICDISWSENEFVKKYALNSDVFYVVYAGNIGAMQNVEILIHAADKLKEFKDIRFLIIGDGVKKSELIKNVKEHGLDNIEFYPMQPADMAVHIYSMANVNIVPLKKGAIRTALPSKIPACLSCGRPMIACVDTDSEFARTLAKYGAGVIVSPDNADELSEAILRIKGTKDINPMGAAARQYFKDCFRKSENVRVYSDVLLKISEC